MTPFQVLYGKEPSGLTHYELGSSLVGVVDESLILREDT